MVAEATPDLEAELLAAGFSARSARALSRGTGLTSLNELRDRDWGDPKQMGALSYELSIAPGLGSTGLAEVLAFRLHGDPSPGLTEAQPILAKLRPREVGALDAWIARQPDPRPSRGEALRILALRGLGSEAG